MILALAAFIGFFLESVFGFGGTVIFLGLAGFFVDFKTLLYISMYVSALASALIVMQQYRHVSLHHLSRIALIALPGVMLGAMLIDRLAHGLLLHIFAAFLLLYGLQGLLFPALQVPKPVRYGFVGLGGLVQGLFATGGPFILIGYRDFFAGKAELRATMAAFFCGTNLLRIAQNTLTTGDALPVIAAHLHLGIAVAAAILLGYMLHLRISERLFQKAMTLGLTAIGVLLLLR